MTKLLETINHFVWGIPALLLITGVGLYLSFRTGFAQFTLFPRALHIFKARMQSSNGGGKGISPYQALCTALAATVGTGNLAGVAGAIAIGGPGAVFWMWVCGLLGMATKYAEATLAVAYRSQDSKGNTVGGPMYMICNGMGKRWSWLSLLYSFFGIVAAFGVGNATQVNTVIDSVNTALAPYGISMGLTGNLIMGTILAGLIALVLCGGAKRIGSIAERLVPVTSAFYLILCIGALAVRFNALPRALSAILTGAFEPNAVTGGAIGSAFVALRVGAARGVFTNEAGMGTASIAHASADVADPPEQGLRGIMEVFIDTIVICTMTALVILSSDVPIAYGLDTGMALTLSAFSSVYGDWICIPISFSVCCFAFATIIGWSMYGTRCTEYLLGEKHLKFFVIMQSVTVVLGALIHTGTVWLLSETVNGLMAIPNLIALAVLAPKLVELTQKFKQKNGRSSANGDLYENFNQRQSL